MVISILSFGNTGSLNAALHHTGDDPSGGNSAGGDEETIQLALVLVNQKLTSLKELTDDKEISIGSMVDISDRKRLLLSNEEGGKVIIVSMANE